MPTEPATVPAGGAFTHTMVSATIMANVTKAVTDIVAAAVDGVTLTTAEVEAMVTAKIRAIPSAPAPLTTAQVRDIVAAKLLETSAAGGGAGFQPAPVVAVSLNRGGRLWKVEPFWDFLSPEQGIFEFGEALSEAPQGMAQPYLMWKTEVSPNSCKGFLEQNWESIHEQWADKRSQGKLANPSFYYLPNPTQNFFSPLFFFPLAQAWGGKVRGYLDISFTITKPPATSNEIKVCFFHGNGGSNGQGGRATAELAGTPANIAGGTSEHKYDLGLNGIDHASLDASPFVHFRIPIEYERKAPKHVGALDNQYFFTIVMREYDTKFRSTNWTMSFVAFAATDHIVDGWAAGQVPTSLNA